jgi:uncharacterized phage protein (TIGR02220 family)/predicted phage replisome organizer
MFDNRKIKHLRKLPEGNSIVLIWVMLLTMAGRCNSGGMIFLTENIPYTTKMLADELGFEESTVQLALQALEQFNMVVSDCGYFTIAGWEEYQNIDGLEKIKEQNRLRQKKWYDNKKALPQPNVRSNVSLTQPNAPDIEEEKELEKEKELYSSIVSYLNKKAGTKYKPTTEKTKKAIHARLADGFTLDDFKTVIDKKCVEWTGTEFEKYLRPETLFGNKFEGYLNAKVTNGRNGNHGGASGNHVPDTKKIGHYI